MKRRAEPPGNGMVAPPGVALVTAYFWPEQLGCAPYMTDLASHLAMRGHTVDVFTAQPHYPRKNRQFTEDLRRQDSLPGLAIRRARILDRSSGRLGIRLANDLSFALQAAVAAAAARRDWSVALVLAPSVLAVPVLRLVRPRLRIVAAVYDIESGLAHTTGLVRYPWIGRLLDAVERWCLDRADALVVLTPQMKAALVALGVAPPIHVVPIWPLVAPQLHKPPDGRPMTVMYSGGLTRRHSADMLPALWQHLRRLRPDCRMIVQGDGQERDSILPKLDAIGGPVTVRPSVDRDRLAACLAEADLQLVLQADQVANFTMPSKALTCLASGVPFVTNASVGSPLADFATASGGGFIVPRGTPADLAEAAATLLAAPQELSAMAERGVAYVRRHYDPVSTMCRYNAPLFAGRQAETVHDTRLAAKGAEP